MMERFQVFLLLSLITSGAHSASFTLINRCPYTVWPGILSGGGSRPTPSTGYVLGSGASTVLSIHAPWSGRFWGRTQCTNNGGRLVVCTTGDCASGQVGCNGAGAIPPATLAEFTLGGYGGKDYYDISLVDGFNLPISITPRGRPGCGVSSCSRNVNSVCPGQLSVRNGSGTVACKSACLAFHSPQYCCTGSYGQPSTCPPTNFSRVFKNACPQAYSYAYDDKTSTFTCGTGADYTITFCP
ncbi:hypothetical protein GIB67_017212 [Kingdonia uniflora]|uniref:Thaumatin-like protein n=1 Tax=Kingdonia uniflora TaxID=39325 RepID=A0A7J7NKK5_9MAGN|nr:hypothetical protein GIB67_017212 [Kingdonia uniflora]